ncbi:peptide chain release factor N(5)-glutamine methyltransferase [Alicyclobacillus sp. SO9]|uniref:peptide chain release factor N(5)-glutamine methyltransferase n=1 Tax=Alicyclobacillus sp. SO9 TaxID=2665646 RepID=UPI0018E7880F|nr:peptide chain release factor N(5)-glutamine methyltransferase [Alicyclobacillus sp. SO9]QQE78807.1 peptide chain release factor N(5)-glutamine methyltransferase [Alicyclobacillus sp. SO9]
MSAETWSIGEALSWASSLLLNESQIAMQETEHRQSILRSEAEMLLQWAGSWNRVQLLSRLSEPIPAGVAERFAEAVRDRANSIPLQYITGSAGFYGREFAVDEGCLIPRPETEWLVETAKEWITNHHRNAAVVDVGTGSGAIAVTLKLECPGIQMRAVDVSEAALNIAQRNAKSFGAEVSFHYGDGIELVRSGNIQFNVLVTNPPYIPTGELDSLDIEVRDFEPKTALDGGVEGLDFYRRLIEMGQGVFAPGSAALFAEVGAGQAEVVSRSFKESGKWNGWHFWTVADLRGIERIVAGSRGVI